LYEERNTKHFHIFKRKSFDIHINRSSFIYLYIYVTNSFLLKSMYTDMPTCIFSVFDYNPKRQQYIYLHFLELSLRRSVSMRGKYSMFVLKSEGQCALCMASARGWETFCVFMFVGLSEFCYPYCLPSVERKDS
jgi:hypothetical protein